MRIHRNNTSDHCDIGMLFASAFLIYGFNSVVTSAMPEYILSIGGDALSAGAQNSLFTFAAVFLRIFLGPFSDQYGSKALLLFGAAGFFLPCALLPFCNNTHLVLMLRLLQSIGLAAYYPNVARYIAIRSNPSNEPRRIGTVRLLSTLSLMSMPAMLLPFIDEFGYAMFFSALAVISGIGFLLIAPLHNDNLPPRKTTNENAQTENERASSAKRALMHSKQSGESKQSESVSRHIGIILPTMRIPREFSPVVGSPFVFAFGYSIVLSFGPMYVETVSPGSNGGFILVFLGLGGLLGNLVMDRLLSSFGAFHLLSALGLLSACGMGLTASAAICMAPLATIYIGAGVFSFGYYGATAALIAELGLRHRKQSLGSLFSAQQNCLDLGIMLGSLFAGLILQLEIPLYTALFFSAVMLAVFPFVWHTQHNKQTKQ